MQADRPPYCPRCGARWLYLDKPDALPGEWACLCGWRQTREVQPADRTRSPVRFVNGPNRKGVRL